MKSLLLSAVLLLSGCVSSDVARHTQELERGLETYIKVSRLDPSKVEPGVTQDQHDELGASLLEHTRALRELTEEAR